MIQVIDASVAIKWFIQEPDQGDAFLILEAIQNSPKHFVVPELFFNEMLAVLCRIEKEAKKVQRHLYLLENLGFERVGNGSELLALAAQLSSEHNLTGYDAIYAATAKLLNGLWVTADARAHQRIRSLGISKPLTPTRL